jgi:MATE family multidrug resistance protein
MKHSDNNTSTSPNPGFSAKHVLHEAKALLWLGTPIIISQLAQTAMGFVDTIMAGHYSPVALAAVAIGTSLWLPILLALSGTLMALTPIVAQAFGAKNYKGIAEDIEQGFWLALLMGGVMALALWHSSIIFHWIGAESAVIEQATGYVRAVAWGMPAAALFQVLRSLNEGFHQTRPYMLVSLLALALNVPLNYLFIYGFEWHQYTLIPAMGAEGCGWATAIVMWSQCLLLAWRSQHNPVLAPAQLFSRWTGWNRPRATGILKLGLPIGLSIFVEVSMFSLIALFIAQLGANVIAGHQITISFTSMTFMIPLSLSMAITIRTGYALGQGQARQARFISYVGIALTLCTATLSAGSMLLFPQHIAALYTQHPQIRDLAISLLILAGIFQFSDALQVSAAGALRAYKDTRVPFLVVFMAYWMIGLPLGYTLGLSDQLGQVAQQLGFGHWTPALSERGPQGFWLSLIAGLSVAALLLNLRLRQVSGRFIRDGEGQVSVIENP